MTDVNVDPDARTVALIHEPYYFADVAEQTQSKRFKFKRDINILLVRIIP
jgi:hypothetical protein